MERHGTYAVGEGGSAKAVTALLRQMKISCEGRLHWMGQWGTVLGALRNVHGHQTVGLNSCYGSIVQFQERVNIWENIRCKIDFLLLELRTEWSRTEGWVRCFISCNIKETDNEVLGLPKSRQTAPWYSKNLHTDQRWSENPHDDNQTSLPPETSNYPRMIHLLARAWEFLLSTASDAPLFYLTLQSRPTTWVLPAALPLMMALVGILGCGRSHEPASATHESSTPFSVSWHSLSGNGTLMCASLAELAQSNRGCTGTLSWRWASGLAEWISVSQETHNDAASALQVTTATATSQTSHIHTRSCREASLLAPCTLPSQPAHKYAASARQYTTALEMWHASHDFGILPWVLSTDLRPSTPPPTTRNSSWKLQDARGVQPLTLLIKTLAISKPVSSDRKFHRLRWTTYTTAQTLPRSELPTQTLTC